MNEYEIREIEEAISAADDTLGHLYKAKEYLDSAGAWGILDIFGGGLFSGIIKHSKMSNAEQQIEAARNSLRRFSKELRDVTGYSSIHISEFLTFADFFFDGVIADVLVQSKIKEARNQCDDAIRQVSVIKNDLETRLYN